MHTWHMHGMIKFPRMQPLLWHAGQHADQQPAATSWPRSSSTTTKSRASSSFKTLSPSDSRMTLMSVERLGLGFTLMLEKGVYLQEGCG